MVQTVKCLPTMQEIQVRSLGQRKWQPTPVLVSYSPWGCKELDMKNGSYQKKSHWIFENFGFSFLSIMQLVSECVSLLYLLIEMTTH